MKKFRKLISICLVLLITIMPSAMALAHDLTPYAKKYIPSRALTTVDKFYIMSAWHINGNSANYYWGANTSNTYSSALSGAVSTGWGNMIDISLTATSSAHFSIVRNPNYTGGDIAWVETYSGGTNHIPYANAHFKLVLGPKADAATATQKRQIITHELGHLWAIWDLYDYSESLESIYSQPFKYNSATRHDRNAMYIGTNNPWYLAANGAWWYQESVDSWAYNKWKYISGSWYYFQSNGYMATQWQQISGYWYYLGANGKMAKGWLSDNGNWYYLRTAVNTPALGPEGAMLANGTWTISGKKYTFNASGVCTTPNGF